MRPDLAIVGINLASAKQAAAVVADHDSITLGGRMFAADPWVIDEILDWALPIAARSRLRRRQARKPESPVLAGAMPRALNPGELVPTSPS